MDKFLALAEQVAGPVALLFITAFLLVILTAVILGAIFAAAVGIWSGLDPEPTRTGKPVGGGPR